MATLADEFANQAALRTEIRNRLGHPNETALLPDSTVDGMLRDALNKLNKQDPAIGVGTFTTVASQQSYTPLAADDYIIRNAWWPANTSDCVDVFDKLVTSLQSFLVGTGPINADAFELQTSTEPQAVFAVQRESAWLQRLLGSTARVFDSRTVYLVPEPTTSGDIVVFTYSTPRYATVLSVDARHSNAFWAAAEWLGHKRLAVGAGSIVEVVDPDAGVKIKTDAAKMHMMAAKESKREFLRSFSARSMGKFP